MKRNLLATVFNQFATFCCNRNYSKKIFQLSRIILSGFLLVLLANQVSIAQSSTCVINDVANDPDSTWSEECYLNDNCAEQGNPCQANDVNLIRAYIADAFGNPISAFDCNDTTEMYLWGDFVNGTGTNRYAVRTRTEVYLGNTLDTVINDCSFDTMIPDTVPALLLGPYLYTCGSPLSLVNTWIGWSTSSGSQCDSPLGANYNDVCGEYPPAKCSKEFAPIDIIVPNIDYYCQSAGIETVTVCFTGSATGGSGTYTYSWDFGDNSAISTGASTCHTYSTATQSQYTATLTVSDGAGASGQVVVNLDLPVALCPADIEICDNESPFEITGASGSPLGGSGLYTYVSGPIGTGYSAGYIFNSINFFDPSTAGPGIHNIRYTYTYNDPVSCNAFCDFTITVYEHTVAVCPDNLLLCASLDPYWLNSPDGGVYTGAIVGYDDIHLGGTYFLDIDTPGGPWTITYTFTDVNGCIDACTFDVEVSNGSLSCPPGLNLEGCNTDILETETTLAFSPTEVSLLESEFLAAGALSACAVSWSYYDSQTGTCPIIVTRVFTVEYSNAVVDTCHQTIRIDDTTPAVITGTIADSDLEGCDVSVAPAAATTVAALELLGLTITDACSDDLDMTVSHSDNAVGTCPIVITRTYTITDECDNDATATHVIRIDDTTPAVITGTIADSDLEGCDVSVAPAAATTVAALELLGLTITDACSDDLDMTVTHSDNAVGTCPIVITRTYTITDECDNDATATHVIRIDDTTLPELSCPGNMQVVCESSAPEIYTSYAEFDAAGGDATDDCGLDYDSFILINEETVGNTIIRTYGIEDICGNLATCEQTITISDLNVETYVYLDGAAINPNGVQTYTVPMRTSLNNPVTNVKVLPGQTYYSLIAGNVYTPPGQPYSGAPWFYNGNEGAAFNSNNNPNPGTAGYAATVVDWVLVSLRETDDGIPVCMKAALLHNDGLVQFVDGGFDCCDLELTSAYYLVIEHRNHLIVMSPNAIPVVNGTLTFDFRHNQSYGNGQKLIIPGTPNKYAMYAGNGDQTQEIFSDTEISFDDDTYWGGQNGTVGRYRNGDFNLNGDANFNDRTTWEFNNGRITTVPR